MSVLSGVVGGAKLAWFKMLKISARNCTLKFSEIRLMWLFLKIEKSKLVMPGPRQDISARIAAEVEALQVVKIPALTIVRAKKCSVRRSGHGKALGLHVVIGIPGICKRLASGPAEPIRKSPVVVVLGHSWIIPCPPGCREWDAVADGEDGAKFPSIGNPSGWSRK